MNPKWKVLISAPYMQPVVDKFIPDLRTQGVEVIIPPVRERLSELELMNWVEDVDGVICGDDQFTPKVLHAAPKLKVISKWGTGIDSIDEKTCRSLGISVRNTPNAFSIPVADSVLGYILAFARKQPWMDSEMKEGNWNKIPGFSLKEATIGVIGAGNVGKAVIKRLAAFEAQILVNDLVPLSAEFLKSYGAHMVSFEKMLSCSDFISLNCSLNPTSYHILSEVEFGRMKPNCVIINTARGPCIDEIALIKALERKTIAGAALDVFENEPLLKNSPLRNMSNVMLAPHNSNSSPSAWEYVHRNTIANLLEELRSRSDASL
jgi:D-3-phosphoglycerate dehydrogenase